MATNARVGLSDCHLIEEECCICLDPLQNSKASTLPCSHRFHTTCINRARTCCTAKVCPLCRAELPPGAKELFDEAIEHYCAIEERVAKKQSSWDSLSQVEEWYLGEAVRLWTTSAEMGLREAQYNLALMFRQGRGVAQSDSMAVCWYRLAAEQGHANAQNNLGFMLNHSRGTALNEAEAVKWYKLAAEQGLADAQYNLGVMYRQGRGIAESEEEALFWYREAARNNSKDAQNALERHRMLEDEKSAADQKSMALQGGLLEWPRPMSSPSPCPEAAI